MRVIAGQARGRRLRVPRSPQIRPTADRVREAVLGSIHAKIPGSQFLDLCAGTGAMGIEALSRGAEAAVFVELDPRVARVIRENLQACGLAEGAKVMVTDALKALERFVRGGQAFHFIYVDPPYNSEPAARQASGALPRALRDTELARERPLASRASTLAERILRFVDLHPELLTPGGRIIFEHRSKDIVRGELNSFTEDAAKHFGDRWVCFYAHKPCPEPIEGERES